MSSLDDFSSDLKAKDDDIVIITSSLRKCTHCGAEKQLLEFPPAKKGKGGLHSWCRKCCNTEAAASRDPVNRKDYYMKYLYNISVEEYQKMLTEQNGVCYICHRKEHMPRKTDLAVDHDKKTGRVRGLLCSNCNRALGFIEENPVFAENLLNYIKTRCIDEG